MNSRMKSAQNKVISKEMMEAGTNGLRTPDFDYNRLTALMLSMRFTGNV